MTFDGPSENISRQRPPLRGWSQDGVPGWCLLSQITHSISSSHLQLESLSHRIIVVQRMWCNWALIIRRLTSQLDVGLATFDVATWCRLPALPVVNALMRSLKSTMQSRAVQILMIKIEFDPAVSSNSIYQDRIQFEFSTQICSNLSYGYLTRWLIHSELPEGSTRCAKNTDIVYLVVRWVLCAEMFCVTLSKGFLIQLETCIYVEYVLQEVRVVFCHSLFLSVCK